MINSNSRKLALSGWLKQNSESEYNTPLKLQKFLVFYEMFTKVAGEKTDFSYLRGYKNGPVFSNVWGDYTKERNEFNRMATENFQQFGDGIDGNRVQKCAFLVKILSERELSDLTHKMNLWKAKEERILSGELQVSLSESDFTESDAHIIETLDKMYPNELINDSDVIEIDNHYFVFSKNDMKQLQEQHFDVLASLSRSEELHNPVYVEIDDEGRLVID